MQRYPPERGGGTKSTKRIGVGIIYLGLESGDPEVLKRIKKNATWIN